MRRTRIIIQPEAYWFLCVCLLLLPFKLVLVWFISVYVHESFHYIALKICKCPVSYVSVGVFGAKMVTGPLSRRKELFCAVAGPLGGAILLIFIKIWPLLSIAGILHSLFNIIPVYPLDGGRVVHSLISILAGERYDNKIHTVFDILVSLVLLAVAVYGFIKLSFGFLPVIFVLGLLWKNTKAKFSCKLSLD